MLVHGVHRDKKSHLPPFFPRLKAGGLHARKIFLRKKYSLESLIAQSERNVFESYFGIIKRQQKQTPQLPFVIATRITRCSSSSYTAIPPSIVHNGTSVGSHYHLRSVSRLNENVIVRSRATLFQENRMTIFPLHTSTNHECFLIDSVTSRLI